MSAAADGTGPFEYTSRAQRVVFCPGAAAETVAREAAALGARRLMLIASKRARELADDLTAGLPVVEIFHDVRPHVPVIVANQARERARAVDADLLVCVGGGSTTGTAKAVALTSGLPIIAVPTTYSGSEATAVWGLTADSRKTTGSDPVVVPRVVVYDADLTLDLPVDTSVASGLNALAHCIDSLWAPNANPIGTALAMAGAAALRGALPGVHRRGADRAARQGCLYGAYLAAVAFSASGSGLHHRICHVLGGAYDLPHAQTHAVVLPQVLAFNVDSVPGAADRLAAALGASDPLDGLLALYAEVSAPMALRDLGLREDALAEAAELVAQAAPSTNPRPFSHPNASALVRAAWAGADPTGLRG